MTLDVRWVHNARTGMKTNGKRRKPSEKKQQQVRMDDALKDRIDVYREKLKEENVEVSFSQAARTLLGKGLDAEGIP